MLVLLAYASLAWIGAAEVVALVAHDAEQLGGGELRVLRRHRRPLTRRGVGTALAIGIAVHWTPAASYSSVPK